MEPAPSLIFYAQHNRHALQTTSDVGITNVRAQLPCVLHYQSQFANQISLIDVLMVHALPQLITAQLNWSAQSTDQLNAMTEPVNNPIFNVQHPPLVLPQIKDVLMEVVFQSEITVVLQLPALMIAHTNVMITHVEPIQPTVLQFQLVLKKPQFYVPMELVLA